jgi:hypothetical protein
VKRKRILWWLGLASVGAAAAAQFIPAPAPATAPLARRAERGEAPNSSAAALAALPAREAIGKPQGELFGPRSWAPPKAAERAVAIPEKPAPPPIPYRIAGQVIGENGMRVVLSKGDRVFEVRQGETLEDGYRVEAITPQSVTFSYVPLGVRQEVQVAGTPLDLSTPARSAAAAPKPAQRPTGNVDTAQLRFEGPQEVQAGKPFDVALKLTSPQPVRALPMQLSFDAKHLEPLAVRAGELFAGGSFTYRVNANGSIFVGASGSGRAALDSNLLVVTFRPIASGPAELKVSSLQLQGAAGRTIAHEPPQAFRAAIVE